MAGDGFLGRVDFVPCGSPAGGAGGLALIGVPDTMGLDVVPGGVGVGGGKGEVVEVGNDVGSGGGCGEGTGIVGIEKGVVKVDCKDSFISSNFFSNDAPILSSKV